MAWILDNWQFSLNLVLGGLALWLSIKALRSSRRTEEIIVDEVGVGARFSAADGRTQCTLDCISFPVEKVWLRVGSNKQIVGDLIPGITPRLTFPFVQTGTQWELGYVDPALKKRRRQHGVVRYREVAVNSGTRNTGEGQVPQEVIGKADQPSPSGLLYPAVTQHWVHSEQIRWTLLYNFLLACSILLLAWATVFASSGAPATSRTVLFALSIFGALLSLAWAILGYRSSGFVKTYADLGAEAETSFATNLPRPFLAAEAYRQRECRIARSVTSRHLGLCVPGVFLLLFLILLWLGWV